VTKRSCAVTPESAFGAVVSAIALAKATPHGPVHLSVPADVAVAPAHGIEATFAPPSTKANPTRHTTDAATLERARALLADASRPALIVGLNVIREHASDAVRRLASATGAIVAALPKAKGAFPEDDPHFVGTLEMVGDDLVVGVLREADVIVMAGVDMVEFDKPWRLDAPIIQVDVGVVDPTYVRSTVQLAGDLATNLALLLPDRPATGWTSSVVEAHRAALAEYVHTHGSALQTWQVIESVRRALPRSAIAASDVGAHKMVVGQAWQAFEPRTFFMANGLSSMGYSVPVGVAARLVAPDRPAVSFVGDGGLGMYLGELETLVRLGLDLLIVVLVDGTLELIRRAQARRGVPYAGTSFGNPDFAAVGRAFGIATFEADSSAELERVLPDVVAGHGVRLLAARIDGNDYRF
jgi:acetolactate synthase-1/2/3 large subunit